MSPTYRADRLKADLRARGWSPTDLVKVLVAKELPDEQYAFTQKRYMKQWARVHRFLGGQSSIATAQAIADAMGYAASRYITVSATARKHGIS